MILAIDVGNTNLVLALGSEAGSVDSVWRISTDAVTSADACSKAIRKTLGTKLEEVDNSVIASVVPAITRHVATAMEGVTGRAPLVIGESGVDLGIAVNIDRPEQAGADRVVNAVGAQVHHQLPAVILDFGTATTLDLVGADGAYEGGIIAPGVALSIEALERAAAQLPKLELRAFGDDLPVLGKNTVAAMESGVFWGYVSMIEGLLARLRSADAPASADMPAIVTGGLAPLFARHLAGAVMVDQDLTVKGLLAIFARNTEARHDEDNDG